MSRATTRMSMMDTTDTCGQRPKSCVIPVPFRCARHRLREFIVILPLGEAAPQKLCFGSSFHCINSCMSAEPLLPGAQPTETVAAELRPAAGYPDLPTWLRELYPFRTRA